MFRDIVSCRQILANPLGNSWVNFLISFVLTLVASETPAASNVIPNSITH